MQGVAPVGLHYKHFLATPLLPCGPADAPMAKFTGNENEGSPPKPGNHMEMTLHAFSHFMILYTDKTFMLCDLQGSKKLRYDRVANTRLQEPTISPAQCASLTRNRTLRKLIPCILTRLITATTGCRILKIESIGIKGKLPSTIFFNTTFAPAQTTSFAMPYSSRSRNVLHAGLAGSKGPLSPRKRAKRSVPRKSTSTHRSEEGILRIGTQNHIIT